MDLPITVRAALLCEFARGPDFGFKLIQRVQARAGVALKEGSVYPSIAALLRDGMIERRPDPGAEPGVRRPGGRPRIYYAITSAGLEEAAACRQLLAAFVGT